MTKQRKVPFYFQTAAAREAAAGAVAPDGDDDEAGDDDRIDQQMGQDLGENQEVRAEGSYAG